MARLCRVDPSIPYFQQLPDLGPELHWLVINTRIAVVWIFPARRRFGAKKTRARRLLAHVSLEILCRAGLSTQGFFGILK